MIWVIVRLRAEVFAYQLVTHFTPRLGFLKAPVKSYDPRFTSSGAGGYEEVSGYENGVQKIERSLPVGGEFIDGCKGGGVMMFEVGQKHLECREGLSILERGRSCKKRSFVLFKLWEEGNEEPRRKLWQ